MAEQSLLMNVLLSPNKDTWMAELFLMSDDKEYQGLSQKAKDIMKAQGDLEAHEILIITDAVWCSACYDCSRPGHTYCLWGQNSVRSQRRSCATSYQVCGELLPCFHNKRIFVQSRLIQRPKRGSQRRLQVVPQGARTVHEREEKVQT